MSDVNDESSNKNKKESPVPISISGDIEEEQEKDLIPSFDSSSSSSSSEYNEEVVPSLNELGFQESDDEHDKEGECENEITESNELELNDVMALFNSELQGFERIKKEREAKRRRPTNTAINNNNINKDPNYHIARLQSGMMKSPFDVLELEKASFSESLVSDANRNFRRISLIVHPDKCQISGAADCFRILQKAFTEISKGDLQDYFVLPENTELEDEDLILHKEFYTKAKKRLLKKRRKMERGGIWDEGRVSDHPELKALTEDFEATVLAETEEMKRNFIENREYEKKVKDSNANRIQERLDSIGDLRKTRHAIQREWDKGRNSRVLGWRTFNNNKAEKNFIDLSTKKIEEKREERDESKHGKILKKYGKMDEYKKKWR